MKTAVTISIDEEILKKIRAVSVANRRTLSAQIEMFCEEKLKQKKESK